MAKDNKLEPLMVFPPELIKRFIDDSAEEKVMNITYRQLKLDETERIREINASQFIGRAWRKVNGIRQLIEINYQDPDFPNSMKIILYLSSRLS